ncbi:hypothetical protein [Kitasatospora purpeofusca]|uniref:hypothetical protein n=1 Tax=Kitasatospora purpeofusca TaxID=67352 RepID=UPI003804CFA7
MAAAVSSGTTAAVSGSVLVAVGSAVEGAAVTTEDGVEAAARTDLAAHFVEDRGPGSRKALVSAVTAQLESACEAAAKKTRRPY